MTLDRPPADPAAGPASGPGADPATRLAAHLTHGAALEGAAPERIETHISWVLLTPEHAYKIKKPVRYSFVDFHTLDARRAACLEELRLNRRTAPALYLHVAAIVQQPGGALALLPLDDGAAARDAEADARAASGGTVLDYAVVMRRFDGTQQLDHLLERGALTPPIAMQLAESVARFHQQAEPVREPGYGTPEDIHAASGENIAQLIAQARDEPERALLQRYAQWNAAQEQALGPLFTQRREQGRVVDAHGDLHLANLCLHGGEVLAFDCLEFSRHLRCIDVVNDLAFLVMDLHARHAPALAWRVLNRWLELTGDYAGLPLLRYYTAYRAAVRLKVARLAQQPGADNHAQRYLRVIQQMLEPPQPRLVITHGLSGSGKTTRSQSLIEQQGGIRVRADVERKRLHGVPELARLQGAERDALYSPEATERTYAQLGQLAQCSLQAGYLTVVDAAFLKRAERDAFRAIARQLGVPFAILHCTADVEVLRERLRQRQGWGGDASDAGVAVLERQLGWCEGLEGDELGEVWG